MANMLLVLDLLLVLLQIEFSFTVLALIRNLKYGNNLLNWNIKQRLKMI